MPDQARDQRREIGAPEADVMTALWGQGTPMTAGQVNALLGDDELAYKTVLTVLGRPHTKGLLARERVGRAPAQVATALNPVLAPVRTAALTYLRHHVTARVSALQAVRPAGRWTAVWPAAVAVVFTATTLADATVALARCLEALHR